MEKTFTRVRSVKDITISASLIVLGLILIILPTSAAVNITGFFMIIAGILLALFLKTEYRDVETMTRYLKKEHYFQQAMNAEISEAIAFSPESVDLSEEDKGNAVRLDVYYSKSANKAYVQLHEYIPYRYEPCSDMFEYELFKVSKLIA